MDLISGQTYKDISTLLGEAYFLNSLISSSLSQGLTLFNNTSLYDLDTSVVLVRDNFSFTLSYVQSRTSLFPNIPFASEIVKINNLVISQYGSINNFLGQEHIFISGNFIDASNILGYQIDQKFRE